MIEYPSSVIFSKPIHTQNYDHEMCYKTRQEEIWKDKEVMFCPTLKM